MHTILFIGLSLVITFFSSCSGKTGSDYVLFASLNEGLENSTKFIKNQTGSFYYSLEDKLTDPASHEKASIWLPKAMHVQSISAKCFKYLDSLKARLKRNGSFDEKSRRELLERLSGYKKNILTLDSQITYSFSENILDIDRVLFDDIPAAAIPALISKLQNTIVIVENSIVNFCDAKCTLIRERFDTYSSTVIQSSSYVKAGDEIEIIAGVMAFSKSALPVVTINDKIISLGETGAAIYRFRTPTKAGKYTVPVTVQFTDENGLNRSEARNIQYTVFEPVAN